MPSGCAGGPRPSRYLASLAGDWRCAPRITRRLVLAMRSAGSQAKTPQPVVTFLVSGVALGLIALAAVSFFCFLHPYVWRWVFCQLRRLRLGFSSAFGVGRFSGCGGFVAEVCSFGFRASYLRRFRAYVFSRVRRAAIDLLNLLRFI